MMFPNELNANQKLTKTCHELYLLFCRAFLSAEKTKIGESQAVKEAAKKLHKRKVRKSVAIFSQANLAKEILNFYSIRRRLFPIKPKGRKKRFMFGMRTFVTIK